MTTEQKKQIDAACKNLLLGKREEAAKELEKLAMTEQAKEGERLIELFYDSARQYNFSESHGWELDAKETRKQAKACAVICVKEIIKVACDYSSVNFNLTKAYWNGVLEYLNNQK